MTALYTISSTDMTLEDAFGGDAHVYKIPDYQRAFEWRADHEVANLWSDLVEHWKEWIASDKQSEYLLGQIIVHGQDVSLEVSDGQQRLTSLYLLLGALHERCVKEKDQAGSDDGTFEDTVRNLGQRLLVPARRGVPVTPRLQDQKRSGTDFLTQIALGRTPSAVDWETASLHAASNHLRREVETLKTSDLFSFVDCVLLSVKLVLTRCGSAAVGARIFIKLNERGRTPDLGDKLKARLYEKLGVSQREDFLKYWNFMLKDVRNSSQPNIDSFLVRFMVGEYFRKNTTERDLLNRFERDVDQDAITSTKALAQGADSYQQILQGYRPGGALCAPLANIRGVSRLGSFKQYLPLLLALRSLPEDKFKVLAGEIETLLFVYSITDVTPPAATRLFDKALAQVDDVLQGSETAWKALLEVLQAGRCHQAKAFKVAFLNLTTDQLRDSGTRYVLGRLEQHLQQIKHSQDSKGVTQPYTSIFPPSSFGKVVHIEHILPQNPQAALAATEFDEDWHLWVSHLANLTPLEGDINGFVGNKSYTDKVRGYQNSENLLTRFLVASPPEGNSGTARAGRMLKQYPVWNKAALEDRAESLYRLATLVWDVPQCADVVPIGVLQNEKPRPVPQASPKDLKDLVEKLRAGPLAEDAVQDAMGRARGDYLAKAGSIAGLVDLNEDQLWELSSDGIRVAALPYDQRDKSIAQLLQSVPLIIEWRNSDAAQREILLTKAGYSGETIRRRGSEMGMWVRWMDQQLLD